jgi:(1->4)-alpha-D-glucan 1-alpha-D-glucosylmutase
VPDIYQGDELTFLALVDPDNRRPVDWEWRRRALADRSSPKLNLIRALLDLRARRPDAFAGHYEPLDAAATTCAFLRGEDVVVAVPVRDAKIGAELPPGKWRPVVDERYAAVFERG